ncbi:UNVERIFIED_CONTAM: hypothetical protein FKN15_045939 [Acipenser sinensis]
MAQVLEYLVRQQAVPPAPAPTPPPTCPGTLTGGRPERLRMRRGNERGGTGRDFDRGFLGWKLLCTAGDRGPRDNPGDGP